MLLLPALPTVLYLLLSCGSVAPAQIFSSSPKVFDTSSAQFMCVIHQRKFHEVCTHKKERQQSWESFTIFGLESSLMRALAQFCICDDDGDICLEYQEYFLFLITSIIAYGAPYFTSMYLMHLGENMEREKNILLGIHHREMVSWKVIRMKRKF